MIDLFNLTITSSFIFIKFYLDSNLFYLNIFINILSLSSVILFLFIIKNTLKNPMKNMLYYSNIFKFTFKLNLKSHCQVCSLY